MKITQGVIDSFRPPEGKDIWIPDDDVDGFGIRVRNGVATFGIRYSFAGRDKRLTLGRIDVIKLAEARAKAKKIQGRYRQQNRPEC
jgi:hypothetical protein